MKIEIDPLRYRPCGACHELVPSDTGCGHWKPGKAVSKPGRVPVPRDVLTARQVAE